MPLLYIPSLQRFFKVTDTRWLFTEMNLHIKFSPRERKKPDPTQILYRGLRRLMTNGYSGLDKDYAARVLERYEKAKKKSAKPRT